MQRRGFLSGVGAAVTALFLPMVKAWGSITPRSSWFGQVMESFPGAWQRNIVVESTQNILAFSAVYACISLISDDIAKLRIMLMARAADGVWDETEFGSPFLPVLRKPNRYQTRIQFLQQWVTLKLLHGNTYIYLDRDNRGIVQAMYILDSRGTRPVVAPDGEVFYQLSQDNLTGIEDPVTIPASEIIHDRMITPWHPLCGVSPIYACGMSATQGIRIQNNSEQFFTNMSRPSGILTAPGVITEDQERAMKKSFEANFSGSNLGRLWVTGGGLKYEALTIPANDAQLIEQQKWTVEDVARAFRVPLHKIAAGQNPTFTNIGAMNQDYYMQTLQAHIEAIELLIDEALGLPRLAMGVELELENLLRMDPKSRAEQTEIEIRAASLSPDEARFRENRHSVPGGDTPYMQQQNFSLAALAKRDAQDDPFSTAKPAPALPSPDDEDEEDPELNARAVYETLIKKFSEAQHVQNA
jgi:HK97 family phage portal protein